jgi:hypothetical protein
MPSHANVMKAQHELAMFMYTSNTPAYRAENVHLKRAFACLGGTVPSPKQLRTSNLDDAEAYVRAATLESLKSARYAIVTDGWSKRTAVRGAPLINIMICPDDGPAVFWRVEDCSGKIKDADFVLQFHEV